MPGGKDADAVALAILLRLPRGPVGERYGTGDRITRWPGRRIAA